MKFQKIQWIWRGVMVLIIMIGFAVLVEKNLSLSGRKIINYDFDNTPNASIGVWGGQLESPVKDATGSSFQKPIKDALYFDLKTTVGYKTAIVSIKGNNLKNIQLGVRTPPNITSYRTAQFTDNGAATIDLQGATRSKGKYTLALFFDQKIPDDIKLSEMTIALEKDRITLDKIIEKLKSL